MKEWWINLSLREKQAASLGGALIAVLLIYVLIWLPFTNSLESLRNQVRRNTELLTWMRESDNRIQTLEKMLQRQNIKPTASILGIVQNAVNNSPLAKNLAQMRQAENNSVQLSFQKVDFDMLIQWLTQIWQQQGLIVEQLVVTPSGTPGIVSTELVITTSKQ